MLPLDQSLLASLSLISARGFLALILFGVGLLLIGMLVGGRDPAVRSVLGLGMAQRNAANIYQKLGAATRRQAVAVASDMGILRRGLS